MISGISSVSSGLSLLPGAMSWPLFLYWIWSMAEGEKDSSTTEDNTLSSATHGVDRIFCLTLWYNVSLFQGICNIHLRSDERHGCTRYVTESGKKKRRRSRARIHCIKSSSCVKHTTPVTSERRAEPNLVACPACVPSRSSPFPGSLFPLVSRL